MVEKRMPGREAEYMRYDEGDRLRVSQDGNLRAKKQWISYSYDALGRVQEQSLAVEAELIPIRSQAGVSIGEPIESVEPPYLGASVPLRKYVYDTYPSEVQAAGLDFQPIEGLTATDGESLRYDNATGSLTYEKLAVLANDTITGYHQRACYYDYKGRVIQTVERDAEDGILRTSQRYDFVGNLIAQRESYTRAGKTDDIDRTFTYDDRSRLLRETTQVNGGELAVVAYSYDAVGQLSGKTYGTGTHAIHETMEYNIQGWLTAKNSELFDMSLDYYNKWGHIDDVSPSYTGNITSWQWQHKKVDGTADADERAYRYRYDDLSRLTAAEPFSSTSSLHTDWSTEKGITYDRNGNILTLTRTGSSGAVSQSYRFEYVGNQRKKTMNGSEVYTYDANGNMTEDALTGFGISYNLLNLPEDLQDHWGSGEISHRYSYLADGTKKTVGDYENYGYRYVGSLVYHWRYDAIDSFESTSFGGGRIVGTDSGSEVHYFLTDHLGSTRVVAKVTPTERIDLDRKDYYPFGKTWEQPDMPASDNRYTFSGKEFQQTYSSSAHYLDFGARFYDPDGVVFIQQDPLLEKYYSIGQYNYCAGNPVVNVDINGDSITMLGSQAIAAFDQLQTRFSKELDLSISENGTISGSVKEGVKLSRAAKKMLKAVGSSSVNVIVTAENTKTTSTGNLYVGGAFMGNKLNPDGTATAFQEVNPQVLETMSNANNKPGQDMAHEITEAYFGGENALKTGTAASMATKGNPDYDKAHSRAIPQSGGVKIVMYNNIGKKVKSTYNVAKVEYISNKQIIMKYP